MSAEKLTQELPRVRVGEQLEIDLMRMAKDRDRSLSDLIRVALSEWAYGHARKLHDDPAE